MEAYLERIGAQRPDRADLPALQRLQRAHLGTVPFENLSIHLGETVRLDDEGLLDKIVRRRRGGFCYELNGAFALLLRELGYTVTMHAARTWGGERYGIPLDHLALQVHVDGVPWLVDVGFGRFSHHPVRLDTGEPQPDPGGVFVVTPHGNPGGPADLDITCNGGNEYRLDARPYELSDFGPTCWYHQTSPQSHFTRSLTCSRLTDDGGRVTLAGNRLIRTGVPERLLTDEEALATYVSEFGIRLDRLPRIRA
jgi:N-hydroxyarylamine O-acetyltransferase